MGRLCGLLPLSLGLIPVLVSAQPSIVIDHTTTDISRIPSQWIERAKTLVLHYAHTSHGSQIMSGIEALRNEDPRLDFSAWSGDVRPLPEAGVLRIFDGQPNGETYITPELYWSDTGGRALTVQAAQTGAFHHSMWSWCGQQSSNSTAEVQQYLNQMSAWETQFPNMRFILMTGHTDGGSDTLTRNNNLVRDWARQHGKVLFDFADIESYDPAGNFHVNDGDGMCTWCESWCSAHPADCTNLPDDCAHSHPFACKVKAKAFWWLMARLAGWDGTSASVTPAIRAGGVVNAASYAGGAIAAGEMLAVYGDGYGTATLTPLSLVNGAVATMAGGTRVLFDDVPGPMIYSLGGQVCTIAPYSVAGKSSVQIVVEHNGVRTPPYTAAVAAAAPGIFSYYASGSGQGAVINQDGTVNTADNPAGVDTVVSFYLTGEGQTTPGGIDGRLAADPLPHPLLPVTATIDGIDTRVEYSGGAPTLVAGVMQVNVRIPQGTRAGNAVPVAIKVGNYSAQTTITIAVR